MHEPPNTMPAYVDTGYDANHLIDKIVEMQATVVIPPKRNRKDQRSYDAELYKERNIIERFFNKLKHSGASQPDTINCSPTSWAS